MRAINYAIFGLFIAACAVMHTAPPEVRQALAPPGSPVTSPADIDRSGVRIGVTQGSTTQSTLPSRLKNATIVPAPSIKAAIEMLQQRTRSKGRGCVAVPWSP